MIWHSTSTTLKTLWYGLQTKWPKPAGITDSKAFLADLVAGQRAARVAIDMEQDDYFKTLALVPVDILDTISSATIVANRVVSGLVPGSSAIAASGTGVTKQAVAVAQAEADVAKNVAIVDGLSKLIAEKIAEANVSDAAFKTVLQAGIGQITADKTKAEVALVNARAALAVAQALVV